MAYIYIPEKLLRIQKLVQDNLTFRLKSVANTTMTADLDTTNGYARLAIAVSGTNKVLIAFSQWAATTPGQLDGIGLAQRVYSPSKALISYDIDDTLGAVGEIVSKVMWELAKLGISCEVYAAATGAGTPAWADITAANFKFSIDDIQYPLNATI